MAAYLNHARTFALAPSHIRAKVWSATGNYLEMADAIDDGGGGREASRHPIASETQPVRFSAHHSFLRGHFTSIVWTPASSARSHDVSVEAALGSVTAPVSSVPPSMARVVATDTSVPRRVSCVHRTIDCARPAMSCVAALETSVPPTLTCVARGLSREPNHVSCVAPGLS